MAAIHELLNDDPEEAASLPAYTNDFSDFHAAQFDPSLEFSFCGIEGWQDGWQHGWSGGLSMEPQSLQHLYNPLSISDSQQDEEFSLQPLDESMIETWAVENLTPDPKWLTPPSTQETEESPGDQTSQSSPPQVCYGMIYHTAARLSGEMSALDTKLRSPDILRKANSFLLTIKRSAAHLGVYFPNGGEFAILNTQISKVLVEVLELSFIDFEVLADVLNVRETVRTAKKANEATVHVNINIYGPPEIRDKLAERFSKHKTWLQHPEHQRTDTFYDNPHLVTYPDISLPEADKTDVAAPGDSLVTNKQQKFQEAISEVYGSLKRDSRLKTIEGDARLTKLLPHQKTALDFMLQRETGPIEAEFSLWEPDTSVPDNTTGEQGFSHIITKTKSRMKPPETGGGILADEMGMGKSLSILALVLKTLDGATAWQQREDSTLAELPVEGSQALTPTRATLVLVPSALLLHEWKAEIKKHIRESLNVTIYHGRSRDREIPKIPDSDIVLSTYQTIAIESPVERPGKRSPLLDYAWFRVVLDEAHIIRRRTTTFYETVSRLQAKSRWCLSGTPIQNRLEDIGSLFAFIRATPFDKTGMFRRFIAAPFEHNQTHDRAAKQLGQLIDSICLRRSRRLLRLPSQNEHLRELVLSEAERDQYRQTKKQMSQDLQQAVNFDRKGKTFGQFHVQLQLRILCNHGTFQKPQSWLNRDLQSEREDVYYLRSGQATKEVNCSLCKQPMPHLSTNQVYRTFTGNCAHVLCDECLEMQLEDSAERTSKGSSQCPLCRPSLDSMPSPVSQLSPSQDTKDMYFGPTGQSVKMNALMEDVLSGLHTSKRQVVRSLSNTLIIFSCWTKTLDLISRHLDERLIDFGRIDGESPVAKRQATLTKFETSQDMRVLIMTTGTGAFGLNLAAANRIFIVEPQWNPSIENQAIARALRLGQESHVQVIRYVIKDTVEMEMLSQQKRKIKMAALADSDPAATSLFSRLQAWETRVPKVPLSPKAEEQTPGVSRFGVSPSGSQNLVLRADAKRFFIGIQDLLQDFPLWRKQTVLAASERLKVQDWLGYYGAGQHGHAVGVEDVW
ncbi:hypothetical protein H2200_000256 [Cladophialophora chaetospira]|uniref:Uncharacterized protein n=1 Tax=Cladophialophora chaetospira TaxID=386627 RepID=A0AA38XN68_9EURO|nr:hypothetical protein H2200_000256 [Cladophialophora chaetospira]